ncbi:Uracil DNA glycosylase superfamily protein [Pigmentiphaga humi]|uniref:Uracil DNA glycosylase superfamily protein n=1 Tax=Pigmentiphaga humi TaxID=2478468 RepID=A0A3P4B8E4_9BURK|nr:DNA-deoxyinosine glycosylase [Pigmentiphaga humi]VCU71968.1 Uracil DNA glycosylase superfamily protein [Pigmentiphaga humi]
MTQSPELSGFPPVLAPDAAILLLGSFPGVASLAQAQYYAHPRNQFWRLLGACLEVEALHLLPYEERLRVVVRHRVGIWDVVASCRRKGSLDAAVTGAEVNPLAAYLREHAPRLECIGFNGGLSWKLGRHLADHGYRVCRLASSSPAAAMYSFEQKLEQWRPLFACRS